MTTIPPVVNGLAITFSERDKTLQKRVVQQGRQKMLASVTAVFSQPKEKLGLPGKGNVDIRLTANYLRKSGHKYKLLTNPKIQMTKPKNIDQTTEAFKRIYGMMKDALTTAREHFSAKKPAPAAAPKPTPAPKK